MRFTVRLFGMELLSIGFDKPAEPVVDEAPVTGAVGDYFGFTLTPPTPFEIDIPLHVEV